MSQSETSYFTLRPCDKQIGTTDPKCSSQKHTTLFTADTTYLNVLDLPSLPPLSQLLTTDGDKNDISTSVPASHQDNANSANSSPTTTASTSPTTSVAQALVDQEQKEQQLFNTATTTSTISMSSSAVVVAAAISAMTDSMGVMAPTSMHQPPVTAAPLSMLMDPSSAAAAAAMYLPPSQNDTTNNNNNNNNNNTTTATTATAAAAAAASLMASNPMLPPSTATGHPSSFYNMPIASTTSSPTNNTTTINTDLASSLMMPPPNNNSISLQDAIEKNYSFVSIPGSNQRKRPRRRYDEIERLYHCTWPGCTKSYGTLNHLNAHVSMQKHGEKRQPAEFKEMRRNWRRQKKEREVAKKAAEKESLNANTLVNATMATAPAVGPIMPSLQTYNTYAPFPMYTSLPQNMASISAFY